MMANRWSLYKLGTLDINLDDVPAGTLSQVPGNVIVADKDAIDVCMHATYPDERQMRKHAAVLQLIVEFDND